MQNRELLKTKLETPFSANEVLATAAVGALTFPSILGAVQVLVFRPLRVSCGVGRLSSVYGGATVCMAGCIASLAAVKTCSLVQEHWRTAGYHDSELLGSRTVSFSVAEALISMVSSAVVFRALGGRFSSVLPSNLVKAGAFAREWIPAKTHQLATDYEKSLIQLIGMKHGCHSCGRHATKFMADHQPPTKLFVSGINKSPYQRFYPHCQKCSSLQGAVVNSGATLHSKAIRVHPLSLRLYHLFLPLPLGICYWKSTNAVIITQNEIVEEAVRVCKDVSTQTTPVSSGSQSPLRSILGEPDLLDLVTNFPLLIIWRKVVGFLESFRNPGDAFHITLWVFSIVAAFGTI